MLLLSSERQSAFVSLSERSHLDLIPSFPCNILDTCIHASWGQPGNGKQHQDNKCHLVQPSVKLLQGQLCAGIKACSTASGYVISYSCALVCDIPLKSKRPLLDCQHPVLSYLETVFEALNKDLLFLFFLNGKETSLTLNRLVPCCSCESSCLLCTSQIVLPCSPTILLLSG